MAKKTKPQTPSGDVPIQFRPGPVLAALLDALATQWDVTRNEIAKRLAALAACELDGRQYGLVQQFCQQLPGEPDFVTACERLHGELQAVERTRKSLKQPALSEDERLKEIHQIVLVYSRPQYLDAEGDEQEENKRVHERQYRR